MRNLVPKLRLRDKFILAFLLLSLSILIGIGIVNWFLVQSTREDAVSELEEQVIELNIKEVENFIRDIKIKFPFEEAAGISLEQQKNLLEQIMDAQSLEEVSFLGLGGEERGREVFRMFRVDKDDFLEGDYTENNYWLIDRITEVYVSPKRPLLRDQSDTAKFQEAFEGDDYIGPVYLKDNEPIVTIALPVYNKKGVKVFIFTGELNLDKFLQRSILSAKLGNSGYVFIADQEGNIFAHSKEASALIENEKIKDSQTGELIDDILRGGWSMQERNYESIFGADVLAAGKKSRYLGWAVIAEWPEDDAMRIVRDTTRTIIGFSVFAFVAVIVVSIILVSQVTRPIESLSKGAKIIGRGKFDHRLRINSGDELEELANSFNNMAKDLKDLERLREIEIRSKALAETLKREQELSQMKDKFIQVASHQLRTPISVMRWTLDVLRQEAQEKKKLTYELLEGPLKDLHENAKKLGIIFGDLLTISEFGLGYHKKEPLEQVDFNDLIFDVLAAFRPEIEEKKLRLEFHKSPEPIELLIGLRGIKQIVRNLVDNAITYSHEGGDVTIRVEEEKNKVKFSIKDTGIGIPQKEQKHVFSEFFRGSNSVEKKNVGTGLGLYVTKNIVEAYKGEIELESEEGKGSTFWFTLPFTS